MDWVGFEPTASTLRRRITVTRDTLKEYINIIELSSITSGHRNEVNRILKSYLNYIKFKINKGNSLNYFKLLKESCSISYYIKQMYQIRKFLSYLKVEWADNIKLPPYPTYYPKRFGLEDIKKTLAFFEGKYYYKQVKALVLLGATSGIRAEEIYQLDISDIDLENRIVHINHDPRNEQYTKTRESRISFFNKEAQQALKDFFEYFNNGSKLKILFSQTQIKRHFYGAPIRVKDLRKFFSQDWDRRCGPTSIKKLLMGHSGDVDLYHYNAQNEDDLKGIYDKVMSNVVLKSDTIIS